MADSARPPARIPDPPQRVRDDLQPRESETPSTILDSLLGQAQSRRREEDEARRLAEERARRRDEHAACRARLAEAFERAYHFPNEEREQGRTPSPDGFRRWAQWFVALGALLRECDDTIEDLR